MNKKIIAIAIAAAMSAPVMADVKVSGALGGDLTSNNAAYANNTKTTDRNDESSITFNDNGMSQVNFIVTEGNSYGKVGFNVGGNANQKSSTDNATANANLSTDRGSPVARDFFIGHKLGGGMKFQFGTMSGALKNMEKDPYIATFLQLRGSNGITQTNKEFGSASFVKDLLQLTMKAGSANVKIQYDATDNDIGSHSQGHTAVGVNGKAGPVAYFVGYTNGTSGEKDADSQSNVKLGGSMKFGAIKATLMVTTSDTGATDGKEQSTVLMADMGLGNGMSVNAAYGTSDADTDSKDGTWVRVAVAKKLSKKATVYGGYTSSKNTDADAKTRVGAGMTVKF